MRAVALLATYNEERFIAGCLEHLIGQGLEVYVLDNSSTDRTPDIAAHYLRRGVIAIEVVPRSGLLMLHDLLSRKEELASTLAADWFMHVDADEIRVAPRSGRTLAEAFADVEAAGYNAVNFQEYTFIPTKEAPDHDHPHFRDTMRSYYPFLPSYPHRMNAWKRQPERVDLATDAGHRVRFPGLKMYPDSFVMRHYLFLSVSHAVEKWGARRHDPAALARGWHGWRERFTPDMIELPAQADLRTYVSDQALDASNPRARHYVNEAPEEKA